MSHPLYRCYSVQWAVCYGHVGDNMTGQTRRGKQWSDVHAVEVLETWGVKYAGIPTGLQDSSYRSSVY
eukprot:scaffold330504_cov20-Prasinocladus_malaysianus.AAC.1